MKLMFITAALLFAQMGLAAKLQEIKVDAPAPAFSVKDQAGKNQTLADYKGKWVVLEWYNEQCPYVKKHYGSKNMQNLQKTYTEKGVAWLTISTSAKGKEGYVDPKKAKALYASAGMSSTALLLDSDGAMGNTYGALTTPHMFVINPEGTVVYAGAIDNNDSADPKTIQGAKNYVAAALDAGMGGNPIETKNSKPYGCSVKYN